jgi:hypothetical protein
MVGCSSRPRRIDSPIVMLKNRSSPGAPEPAGVERHGRPARPAARQLEHEPPAQRAADQVDPGAAVVGDEAGDGVGERHHGLLAGQQRGLAEAGHSTATTFRSAANPARTVFHDCHLDPRPCTSSSGFPLPRWTWRISTGPPYGDSYRVRIGCHAGRGPQRGSDRYASARWRMATTLTWASSSRSS